MSKNRTISYPYPVLRDVCEDYQKARFDSTISVDQHYEVEASGKVVNARSIRQLLKQQKAAYVLEVKCPKTWYSTYFMSYTGVFEKFTLPSGKVKDTVILTLYLVVTKPIQKFFTNDFIADYEGIYFNFQPGDIIGIGTSKEIPIIYSKEVVKAGKPIIKFEKAADNKLRIAFDDTEAIHIILPDAVFNQLALLQGHGITKHERVINSILVVPAIMQVLQCITSTADEALIETKWYKSIIKRLQEMYGGNWKSECHEEPMRVAEALLDNIYVDAIKTLE